MCCSGSETLKKLHNSSIFWSSLNFKIFEAPPPFSRKILSLEGRLQGICFSKITFSGGKLCKRHPLWGRGHLISHKRFPNPQKYIIMTISNALVAPFGLNLTWLLTLSTEPGWLPNLFIVIIAITAINNYSDSIDILCIEESKLDELFLNSNIALGGHKKPYQLGASANSGSLLIYVKARFP